MPGPSAHRRARLLRAVPQRAADHQRGAGPYISNPDDIVYYDSYELALQAGENVLGLWLGNGFQNNPGGHIWDFDKARFRGAPQVALRLTYTGPDGTERTLESDDSFHTAPSPVLFDDYRFGEHYDARLELPGWNAPGFDDSGWQPALPAPMPRARPVSARRSPSWSPTS